MNITVKKLHMDAMQMVNSSGSKDTVSDTNFEKMDLTNYTYYDWDETQQYQTHIKVAAAIHTYVPPVLIVLGTVGNIVSFCVLRKSTKWCSVFYYMALYALTNTLNLYVACGLGWISQTTQTPYIANVADWLCKIWQFAFNVMRYTSTWLVVAMAFDRFVHLCIPSKVHSLCTVFTAKVISCFIVVILVVISIHAMWTYALVEGRCEVDRTGSYFQTVVWPVFSAIMYEYLPDTMLVVFIVFIIVNLILQKKRRYQNRNFSPLQEQLTVVVLVISSTFVILNLPTIILNIILYFGPVNQLLNNPRSYVEISLANVINQFLIYLLLTVNFPLYFISLPILRKELESMVKNFVQRQNTTSVCSNSIEVNGNLLKKKESSRSLECTLMTQL